MGEGDHMSYRDALVRLLQLVDHERLTSPTKRRVRYDLRRMEALLDRLGNPQSGTPTIHIAGTKGKGSTAAMCASVLSQQGYHTGLFTSPHLHTFRERISLDGAPVSEGEFAALVDEIWPDLQWVSHNGEHGEVTMFEALTAMAFCHFRKSAQFQVLEVGLGGRLDTTNLVRPPDLKVCAITSLSLDHTSVLGNTIEAIAAEKAGIIKPGTTVVTAPQVPQAMAVIESTCRERCAPLIVAGESTRSNTGPSGPDGQGVKVRGRLGNYELCIPLLGEFQLENAATAIAVLEVLRDTGFDVSDQALQSGFKQVWWPCRMEVLRRSPLLVCDGAHNPDSTARLRDTLPSYFNYGNVILVVGFSQDKNLPAMAHELARIPFPHRETVPSPTVGEGKGETRRLTVMATRSRHPRAAPTATVAESFLSHGSPPARSPRGLDLQVLEVEGVDRAVATALDDAEGDTLVLVTGSLFVAAEAREAILGIEAELYPELQRKPLALSP